MMQSQGLGALMPQAAQQMAPQQADPQRLAAATNLVSSDAERQILDPRTLAMLKYKDALQAMQAADQMMAAAQPAPMPPTVAERTKLAAEQGIAGLASRLSPGLQQQGNKMQAQQLQQAMSGGLPQLPAPNMAGMAEGGIVGFQAGGAPEDAYAQPTDYLLPGRVGMLPRENLPTTREELLTEIARLERMQEQAERRRNSNQSQTTPSDGGDAQSRTTDVYAQPTDYLLPGRVGMLPRENLPTTREELQAEIERRERMRKLMENLRELDRTEVPGPYSGPSAAERRAMREEGAQGSGDENFEINDLITDSQFDALMSQYDASIRGQEDADAVRIPPSQATQADMLQARARDLMGGLRGLFNKGNLGRVREIADENDVPFLTKVGAYPIAVGMDFLDVGSQIGEDLASGYDLAKEGVYTAAGQVGAGVDLARGEQPAVQPTAQTSTAAQGRPVVPRQVQPAQQGFTPAPESMSGGMREPTPVERLRAAAAENTAQQGGKDAVDALLEEEQQPRAGESAADWDARMRRLIAGLRGFGAQGLGGFAAGAGEEELRQEQEVIADQERRRRAAMETRGLDLREREITLSDALSRQQADALQADREARVALQQAQLDTQQKEIVAQTVLEEAPGIQAQIDAIELELADPDFGVGFFGGTSDRDERVEELRRLRAFMVNKTEEVMSRFRFTSPGAGGASGSSGLAPEDDALVNAYLGK